jgi:exonuclease VII small subunit
MTDKQQHDLKAAADDLKALVKVAEQMKQQIVRLEHALNEYSKFFNGLKNG